MPSEYQSSAVSALHSGLLIILILRSNLAAEDLKDQSTTLSEKYHEVDNKWYRCNIYRVMRRRDTGGRPFLVWTCCIRKTIKQYLMGIS